MNVKQGLVDKGHVCFFAQINKTLVLQQAVSPLRIPTCLTGLLVHKSHFPIVEQWCLHPYTSVSIVMVFTRGLAVNWWKWYSISWLLSVLSTMWGVAKVVHVLILAVVPRRPQQVQTVSVQGYPHSRPLSLQMTLCKHLILLADHLLNRSEGLCKVKSQSQKAALPINCFWSVVDA